MNDRSYRIALLLKALEDSDREMAEYKTEWKERRTKLENQLSALKYEILSGQLPLIAEGEKPNGSATLSQGERENGTDVLS